MNNKSKIVTLDDPILTPKELAEWLKVNKRLIVDGTREGMIEATKLGKFWRFRRSKVLEFLNAKKNITNDFVHYDDEFLTPEEAAICLKLKVEYIIRMHRTGKLLSVVIGKRKIRFVKRSIEQFAKQGGYTDET